MRPQVATDLLDGTNYSVQRATEAFARLFLGSDLDAWSGESQFGTLQQTSLRHMMRGYLQEALAAWRQHESTIMASDSVQLTAAMQALMHGTSQHFLSWCSRRQAGCRAGGARKGSQHRTVAVIVPITNLPGDGAGRR
jgi:hypothetical protein